ncbi:MAG: phytanoyl-CoA dioxygenase family protein, partial [Chloroflexi bacterium]|nr:phytanoyl-CoA dioxygenase family protein [Chloroflexota bacterium]
IVDGYLLVQTDFPDEFHEGICRQIDAVFEKDGNPGDAILDKVPDLHQIYQDPYVRGALTSILGPDYAMNSHRHCHYTTSGHPGGHWHQDSTNVRHHHIEQLLGMYYPQDVVEAMGPTMILPGTQYHNTPSTYMASYMNFKSQIALNVKAGTVAITHYDIWHAWMPNYSGRARRMLKFLFNRVTAPTTTPSWNAAPDYKFRPNPFSLPIESQSDAYKHSRMWRNVWDWLHGVSQADSDKG